MHNWGHCTTSWNVVGSIPDGAIRIFHLHKLSGRTMAMESTQPVTEMSSGVVLWGKIGQCIWLKTFPPSYANYLEILGAPTTCSPLPLYIQLFHYQSKCISLLISLSTRLSAETSSVVTM